MPTLTRNRASLKFSGDKDESKVFKLRSKLLDKSFLGEIQMKEKKGKLELSFTDRSLTGHYSWGNFYCSFDTKLQLEAKHIEVMFSIKTSVPTLKDITLHILMLNKSESTKKTSEIKVKLFLLVFFQKAPN